MKLEEVIINL